MTKENINKLGRILTLSIAIISLNVGYKTLNKHYSQTLFPKTSENINEKFDHDEANAIEVDNINIDDFNDLVSKSEVTKENILTTDNTSAFIIENIEYKIQPGDTLSDIAKQYNIKSEYLVANNKNIDLKILKIGQTIFIPSENGIFYTIKENDTFKDLENQFSIPVQQIKDDNGIDNLISGNKVFVRMPEFSEKFKNEILTFKKIIKKTPPSFNFENPLNKMVVTSSYGSRNHPVVKKIITHGAVDLKAATGTKVLASRDGVVKFAGYSGNYGNLIVISHPNGYETRYAHLSKINVKKGQKINSKDLIALSGATGRVTGPHLHFEIRKNGKILNPINYLTLNKK